MEPENDGRWASLRRNDARLAEEYTALADAVWVGPLPPKLRSLVLFAASITASGIAAEDAEFHLRNALSAGATPAEIAETVEVVCVLGVHTSTMATPILVEELQALGQGLPAPTEASRAVQADFEARRGYWNELWDAIALIAPEFLAAYLNFSSLPGERNALDPKSRELLLITVNSVTTHLFPDGVRVHIRNALRLGADAAEIMHVFQLLSTIGVRSGLVAFPLLDQLTAVAPDADKLYS